MKKIYILFLFLIFNFLFSSRTLAQTCSSCTTSNCCGSACSAGEHCKTFSNPPPECGCEPLPGSTPTPTQPLNPTSPPGQPTPTPGGGGGTIPTPTPTGPTPTPACTADCSGTWCRDIAGTRCQDNRDCASGYTCNGATKHCQKCSTPGLSCCTYCVPQGFGCTPPGPPCYWCKSCKKYKCKQVQPDICYTDIFESESTIPCAQACTGVNCGAIRCGVAESQCYEDCTVNEQCQSLPPAVSYDPKGWLDIADCNTISGWACDGDDYNQAIMGEAAPHPQ